MDQNKYLIRSVTIAATLLGTTEAILWIVLSALAILCHYQIITSDNLNNTYGAKIYNQFLTKTPSQIFFFLFKVQLIVTPKVFLIFVWTYLSLSLAWFFFSSCLLWAMIRDKFKSVVYLFVGWTVTTAVTCALDAILAGLVVHDLVALKQYVKADFLEYGIVISVASRGYVLWLINVIFVGIFIKFTRDLLKSKKNVQLMPIIYGFETSSVNPPWFQELDGESSLSFPEEEQKQNKGFERSQSFFAEISSNNKEKENNSKKFSTFSDGEIKVATIGRKKKSIFPFIPEPDYTPPDSPTFHRVQKI